jgi:arsenate reductase
VTTWRILFVCVGNMCRSPMAEAIARKAGGERVEVFSAGLSPSRRVAPETLRTLETLGYPTAGLRSKSLVDVPLADMDLIVSLIGSDGAPWLPRNLGARLETWSIPDPCGEDDDVFLAAAHLLERKIGQLLRQLLPDLAPR